MVPGDALEAFYEAEHRAEKPGYLRYRIGKCHANGHGTAQNYEESARWFRQAVEEDSPFAAHSLAGQYLRGQGVEQNDGEAYRLYLKAATHEKQPNAYAQYQLGRMCREGIGTEADPEASRQWYARAYQGFLAMEETMADDRLYYRLGAMNLTGTGTEVDLKKAQQQRVIQPGVLQTAGDLGEDLLLLASEAPQSDGGGGCAAAGSTGAGSGSGRYAADPVPGCGTEAACRCRR